MQVEADGSRSSCPPDMTQNGGKRSLNPRSGGRLQLVTNLSSCCFSRSVKPSTTSQNILMDSWSSLYFPATVITDTVMHLLKVSPSPKSKILYIILV